MPSRYQVPKQRVRVRIRTRPGVEEAAHLFVGEFAEDHPGPESPADVLNSPGDFVVIEDENGEIGFLGRDSLSIVTVAEEDESGTAGSSADGADLATEVRVAITLDDGAVLEGKARYELPAARRRLQDFLNAAPRFLSLYQPDKLLLVNKRRIARVARL